jgi:hypothetical protein
MKPQIKIKIPGVAGYATTIVVDEPSLIEGDVLHYDRALTDVERQRVEEYLREKHKITPPTPTNQHEH